MIERRRFLQTLVAAGCLPARAVAGPVATLRPSPDFARLRKTAPYVVGVRPFRRGGVRLEREALGDKHLVHNYGHAGAGITLSFGCAEAAAALVDEALAKVAGPAGLAVVGTGVIGMTTALAVKRRRKDLPVTIYAKDLDLQTTTSAVAGGQFEPSGVWREQAEGEAHDRLEQWLRASRDRIRELQPDWARYGIAQRDNFTLVHGSAGFDAGTPRDVVEAADPVELPFEHLRGPGRLYRTWLLDPPRLLPGLKSELRARGVAFETRSFASRDDLSALEQPVIANCTGYGAKALVGDDAVIAQRGHLVVLERPTEHHDWLFGGGCLNRVNCYVFCRHDDIVVGGTVIAGDDRAAVVPEDQGTFERLLANAVEVFAGRPERCEL